MSRLRAPGVYFERTDAPARAIGEVRTDVAALVGVAERGPLHAPVRVESWTQFRTRFGDPIREGFLAQAVSGFFANGGQTCWVVRVGVPPTDGAKASSLLVNLRGEAVFRVTARDFGRGTEQIAVRVQPATKGRFTLVLSVRDEPLESWQDLDPLPAPDDQAARNTRNRYGPDEVNAPPDADAPTAVTSGWVDGSVLIELTRLELPPPVDPADTARFLPVGVRVLRGMNTLPDAAPTGPQQFETRPEGALGWDQRAALVLPKLTPDYFTGEGAPPERVWGLRSLEVVEDIGLVAMPDLMWPGYSPPPPVPPPQARCYVLPPAPPAQAGKQVANSNEGRTGFTGEQQSEAQKALIRHCATLRDRFAILDAPAGLTPNCAVAWVAGKQPGQAPCPTPAQDGLRSDAGQFAALYYPWIVVPDPDAEDGVQVVPPSGHVAGMFARVDLTAGVQKPPANEVLTAVSGAESELDAIAHGYLNDEGVNAIRAAPGRGVRVVGARTLVPPGASDLRQWRYVNVRRLLLMLEAAIDRGTQWIVFEPNTSIRWRAMDRVIRNFLDDEWRKGRLDGATAAEAYDVTCDESTNPPEAIEAGRMICVIGVQPPQPAEFVIVKLGQRMGENGTAGAGGTNGG